MYKAVLLIVFLAFVANNVQADKKIVCYFGSWAIYRPGLGKIHISDIDPRLCTHLIYTFVGISTDGEVKILDSWADLANNSGKDGYGKFNALRQLSPGLKTLVAIGGWNEGSVKYSEVAANPEIRARFVENVVKFLKEYKFDGFDVDWEYPNQRGGKPIDKDNFVSLLKELRHALDQHGYLLSVAAGSAEKSASLSYHIAEVSQYVHFINLMTYDYNGSWDNFVGINAPLYASSKDTGNSAELNVNASVRYWLSQGASAEKIVLGVPAYGRSFTLVNPVNNGIGALSSGPGNAGPYTQQGGTLGYNEICSYLSQGGWTVVRDQEQRVPYAYKGNQWVGYDDPTSLLEKARYINSMGLGGAMMWSIETDDFRGTCGEKYPLLKALNSVLRDSAIASSPSDSDDTTVVPPEVVESTSIKPTSTKPTSTQPVTPSNFVCIREGYFRDPQDCSTFYFCRFVENDYMIYTLHCPNGLHFDTLYNVCNYKSLVTNC
ncbi:chitinase-3-like protein 1 [Ptiloglossa arizonensis]|uniref:chitinase-3-like protein 1 n=1 Tax=Ptiloglossa arizonensis TaxID=3350558 RepID=UPI003F9FA931